MLVKIDTLEVVQDLEFRLRFPEIGFPPTIQNHHVEELDYLVLEIDPQPGEFYELGEVEIADGRATRPWVPKAITPAILDSVLRERQESNKLAFEAALSMLTNEYPPGEIQSWERQREEVLAWNADNATATPWVDQAAAARGLDRNTYLTRTLSKVNLFAPLSAILIGHRQKIDDQLIVARGVGTCEAIRDVPISYAGLLPF